METPQLISADTSENEACTPPRSCCSSLRSESVSSTCEEANERGVRSLRWLKRRLAEEPDYASWHDFRDISSLVAGKATPREINRARELLTSIDTSRDVDACVFVERRTVHMMKHKVSIARLLFMLCAREFDDSDRLSSPCTPPSPPTGEQPDTKCRAEPCCVNPWHTVVRHERPVHKRKRQERPPSTYVLTPEIVAEHLCPLLGGELPFKRPYEAKRTQVPLARPPAVTAQRAVDIYSPHGYWRLRDDSIDIPYIGPLPRKVEKLEDE